MTTSETDVALPQQLSIGDDVQQWQARVGAPLAEVEASLLDASLRQIRREDAYRSLERIQGHVRSHPEIAEQAHFHSRKNACVDHACSFQEREKEDIKAYKALNYTVGRFLNAQDDPKDLQALVTAIDEGSLSEVAVHEEINRQIDARLSPKGRIRSLAASLNAAKMRTRGVISLAKTFAYYYRMCNAPERWQEFRDNLHDMATRRAGLAKKLESADIVPPDWQRDFSETPSLTYQLQRASDIAKTRKEGYFPPEWDKPLVDFALHREVRTFEGTKSGPFLGRGPCRTWGLIERPKNSRPETDFRLDRDDLSFFTAPQQQVLSYLHGLGGDKPTEEILREAVEFQAMKDVQGRLLRAECGLDQQLSPTGILKALDAAAATYRRASTAFEMHGDEKCARHAFGILLLAAEKMGTTPSDQVLDHTGVALAACARHRSWSQELGS